MQQKTYLTILKTGIYLSFLAVFWVFGSLLFPFITSKQIYFNILIEILAVFWIVFLIKYPEHSPKKSWISVGLISYFAAILVSCFFSIDFNLSFWGDIERMLGFFHIFHFLIFYFIIITVFREWKEWKILFIISVICAVFVSFYGLANMHYSTIGNTAYVSGYLIFNIYFAALLFFREENKALRWVYLMAIPIMLSEFYKAYTSGAIVGLAAGIFVFLFLLAVLGKNKKLKINSIAAVVILVFLTVMIYANKDSGFVRNNNFLNKLTNNVSFQKATFQTRLISWKAAAKDFKNHPVLGIGYGNYAFIFDKYFDPKFYDYTRAETYFDRAHNNIVDIASTTGLVGLLTYLSIFLAAGYYLIKGFREDKISLVEFSLISSLIVAYFVQNLAVFDSLVTYMGLMAILGYVYWLDNKSERVSLGADKPLVDKGIFSFLIVGILIFTIFYQYNYKPLKMLKGTINGQMAFAQGDIIGTAEAYKKALSYNTVLDRDSRDSFTRIISGNPDALKKIDKAKAGEILDFAILEAEKNIEYNKEDSLMQAGTAQLYLTAGQLYKDSDQNLFNYYASKALDAIDKSIASSPERIPPYYLKAQIFLLRGENDKAIATLEYAISLNEKYYDSVCTLARFYFILENNEKGFEAMDKCLDTGGSGTLSPLSYAQNLVNHYAEKEDWPRIIMLYERLTGLSPNDSKVWVNLASLYARVGDKEKAIEAAKKAGELDPSMKDEIDVFIRSLEK
jgi:O-antigen ligase